ncbi:hypothetical protein AYO22_06427 [Fonsecaea multimorphosa]|nr:hypothetical protein AYO22_06427 [Fonsecaea multimorphosa]
MAREESDLQIPNEDAETLEIICTDCRLILFQPAALATLFEAGLNFQKALTRLRSISQTDCHVCALLRSVLLEGDFVGRQGDESYRFNEDVWGRPICTFTLKAVVDHAKLIHEFIRFDIYFMGSGPIAFWGKSLELVIRPEIRTPHLEFARRWLDDCMKFHADCQDLGETVLPTRVLEILQEDGTPNLKLSTSNGAYGRYMALSYRWGQLQPAKLTTENHHEYAQAIEESNLPPTIRDFIGIARALGVRFIWVDAYCILQDSDDDKQREIGNMGEIYKHSFLTIIASKARSNGGATQSTKAISDQSSDHTVPMFAYIRLSYHDVALSLSLPLYIVYAIVGQISYKHILKGCCRILAINFRLLEV